MKYYELFEELESISGRKEKEKLIKDNWSEELKQIFLRVYDYNRQSYTNKFIKEPLKCENIENVKNVDIIELFDYLSSKGSANNNSKNEVYWFLTYLSELEAKWVKRILLKDLKIGVSEKTLNKLFGDFIPTFEVMLAKQVESLDSLTFPLIAQPKLDGIRCLKIGKTLMGRNGRATSNERLHLYLHNLIKEENYVFDGELYSHKLSFNDILSQVNSDSKEIDTSIKYVVYDILTKTEWENQECKTKYFDRWSRIKSFTSISKNSEWIGGKIINNVHELNEYYEHILRDGYEGIMVKDPNGMYGWKRVDQNVMGKIKPSEDFDCKIIQVKEGTGKYEKKMGAFIVDFNGVKVNVGSGFNDEQRNEFWKNKQDLIGKWISVKAQEKTIDGSLRFPVFIRIRDDK
jgi:DNA ligase-1